MRIENRPHGLGWCAGKLKLIDIELKGIRVAVIRFLGYVGSKYGANHVNTQYYEDDAAHHHTNHAAAEPREKEGNKTS